MSDLALQLYYNWWRWREARRASGVALEEAHLVLRARQIIEEHEKGSRPPPAEAETGASAKTR